MKVLVCSAGWVDNMNAIAKQFDAKVIRLEDLSILKTINNYDLVITLGWDHTKYLYKIWKHIKKPIVFMVDGAFHRQHRYDNKLFPWLVSYYDPGSIGRYQYEDLSSNRWDALGVELKPWRKDGKYVLIAHQRANDYEGNSRQSIFQKIMSDCVGENIVIRGHPGRDSDINFNAKGAKVSKKPLLTDLKEAKCLVTHNSKAAVEAVVDGVPVLAYHKSLVEMVKSPSIKNLKYPDRTKWCNWIAYQHWTMDEIVSGEWFNYAHKIIL